MKLLCPTCQKVVEAADERAGQIMTCPHCFASFQAPALPGAPESASNPATGTLVSAGASAAGAQASKPEQPAPDIYSFAGPPPTPPRPTLPPTPPEAPPIDVPPEPAVTTTAAAPLPTGDYAHTATMMLSPRVTPWVAPVGLALVFVLLFFTWIAFPGVASQSGWGTAFGRHFTVLGLFYSLFFLAALVAAVAAQVLPHGAAHLPPALQQLWPWRSGIVCGLAALAFLFLFLELLVGFGLEHDIPDLIKESAISVKGFADADLVGLLRRTIWLVLAVLFHIAAVVGAALDFWLVQRQGRPLPRLVLNW
jgi:hypothetical protein